MVTNSEFANITEKKLLGYSDLNDRILLYLKNLTHESLEKIWDSPVVYGTKLSLAADGSNAFKITGSSTATDGQGHLLKINDALVNDEIYFENSSGVIYYVALKYTEIPSEIDVNPSNGLPEYRKWIEEIGEKGTPDLVVDNGNGTITFQVDTITESGVSNAGRQIMVYKLIADKNASTVTVAIETCTVTWTGSENRITTTAALGQSDVSEVAADYNVILLGPTVKRYVDLRSSDGYTYIGFITGNASTPTSFDITDQQLASISLSQLSQIASEASNGRLKINVTPGTGESGILQIASRDEDGNVKFSVDEQGYIQRSSYPCNDYSNNIWRHKTWGIGEGIIHYATLPSAAILKSGACCVVNGEKKIIFIDRLTNIAYKFDVETMSLENSHNLSSHYDPSYTWYTVSAFGEGTYLYVLAHDESNRINIQCVDVNSWITRLTWPTTGKLISGVPSHPAESLGRMLIPLDKDYLIYVTGNSSGGVNSLGKVDGTSSILNINNSKGNFNDFDGGSFDYEQIGVCTDGKYIYTYCQYNLTGDAYLCSIDTSDWPNSSSAVGCPGTGHPPALGSRVSDVSKTAMAACCGRIAVVGYNNVKIISPSMSTAAIASCTFSSGYSGPYDMISIGNSIWMKIGIQYSGGSTYVPALFKLDLHKFMPDTGPAVSTITNLEDYGEIFILDENENNVYTAEYNENSMVYDGNDIWLAGCVYNNSPSNQFIHRFHNALYR